MDEGWPLFALTAWFGVASAIAVALFLSTFPTACGGKVTSIEACCRSCHHRIPDANLAPTTDRSATGHCPECGNDLERPDQLLFFRRRFAFARLVLAILVLAAGVLVPIGIRNASRGTVTSVQTRLVPIGEKIASGAGEIEKNLAEILAQIASVKEGEAFDCTLLFERASQGTMLDDSLARITKAIIAQRRAITEAHGPGMPITHHVEHELIRLAASKGLLAPEDVSAYAVSFAGVRPRDVAAAVQARLPEAVRIGNRVPILGVQSDSIDWIAREVRLVSWSIDGEETPFVAAGSSSPTAKGVGPNDSTTISVDRPRGTYRVEIVAEEAIWLLPPSSGRGRAMTAMGSTLPPTATRTHRLSADVRVLEDGDPTWVPTASPSDRVDDVKRACRVSAVAIDRDAEGSGCTLRVDLATDSVRDISLGFDVLVLLDGKEYRVAQFCSGSLREPGFARNLGGPVNNAPVPLPCPDPQRPLPDHVDVLFRPNPRLCERFGRVLPVWGEEIRLSNVPLRTTEPRSTPAEESR